MMRSVRFTWLLPALLLALASCASSESGPGESDVAYEAPQNRSACEAGGGRWEIFPNQCRDFCPYRRGENTDCVQRQAMGCYCPGFRCWNGIRCEEM